MSVTIEELYPELDDKSDITHSRYLLSGESDGPRQERHEKRILIGSIARRLERRREGRWTHQFHIYVKAELDEDEDLANYVDKAAFRFSDSDCANRIIVVDQPPFQTSSYCSLEFPVTLTLLFRDANHTCTILRHELKLRSNYEEQLCALQEQGHTITFVNPSRRMLQYLELKGEARRDVEEPSEEQPLPLPLVKQLPAVVGQDQKLRQHLKRARRPLKEKRKPPK